VLSNDTILGIIAHSTLALGLLLVLSLPGVQVNVLSILIGDILAVGVREVLWIWGAVVVVSLFVWRFWSGLLLMTIDEELARVEGVPVNRLRLVFMVLLACVMALAMKAVGVLLVVALMIIPAALARHVAKTPEFMLFGSVLVGLLSVSGGLGFSFWWDVPSGPAIVVCASLLFFVGWFFNRRVEF